MFNNDFTESVNFYTALESQTASVYERGGCSEYTTLFVGIGHYFSVHNSFFRDHLGTYHGIKGKHLQAYLDEYDYRYNRRNFQGEWFNRLLTAAVSTKTVTYAELTE